MIKIETGQICYISEKEIYDKKGREKIRIALSQANALNNNIEYIEYDLLGEKMVIIEKLNLKVGDIIEVQYQDIGRKYTYTEDDGTFTVKFYNNKEIIKIDVL